MRACLFWFVAASLFVQGQASAQLPGDTPPLAETEFQASIDEFLAADQARRGRDESQWIYTLERMTPEQIVESQRLVREWRPTTQLPQ